MKTKGRCPKHRGLHPSCGRCRRTICKECGDESAVAPMSLEDSRICTKLCEPCLWDGFRLLRSFYKLPASKTAWTIGAVEVYDPLVKAKKGVKEVGGSAWRYREEAEFYLSRLAGGVRIEGRRVPGAVYRMTLPHPFDECTRAYRGSPDARGPLRFLTIPAKIVAKVKR